MEKIKIRDFPFRLFVFRSVKSSLQMLTIIMEQYMSLKRKKQNEVEDKHFTQLIHILSRNGKSVIIRHFIYEPLHSVRQLK